MNGSLPTRVALVGMMGAGKSTVGRLLADRLGYAFVDLDAEVERVAGLRVAELFAELGEPRFRELEADATTRFEGAIRTVVATGGGWMSRPELRDRWRPAVRVWLRVSADDAWRRIAAEAARRPMLDPDHPREALELLLGERQPDYELAEISVPAGGEEPGETADLVLRLLPFACQTAMPQDPATGS